jgi:conjugal transfer pilus assembly protein TraK
MILFGTTSICANQIKSVKDNQMVPLKISATELSRIFVTDDRIQSVRGLNGTYELTKDESNGVIYIKPIPHQQQKSFNIFITTELGHTYNLFLTPMHIPAESVELKPLTPAFAKAKKWEENSPYIEKLVQLIHNMVNNLKPAGYAIINIENNKPIKISANVSMQLIILYRGKHLQGEIWVLTNTSKTKQYLSAKYFFQKNTRAISLDNEVLNKNEIGYLYRVVSHG